MTPDDLTLSIIIPVLNSGSRLKEALNSIIIQTFTNYEVLIIDNLSSDNTLDIINDFASFHNNIRWVSEPDKGIYDAMNKGITLAKGEWLYFLGSDDKIFDGNVFKSVFTNNENLKYDVLYGNVISPIFIGKYDGRFDIEKLYKKNISHQAIFFRKKVFDLTGNFNINYKIFADWDHNFKWLLNPLIKKEYIDIVVATFAAGGFSTTCNDEKFEAEKEINFLKAGKGIISQNLKEKALKTVIVKLYKRHKYILLSKYCYNYFFSIIRLLIKHFIGFGE
jgi:glycosyltransferase involved in cell wall biosynthesis